MEVWRQGHEGPGYALGYNFRDGTIGGSLPNGNYTVQVVSRGSNSSMGIANISVNGGRLSGAMMTLVPSVAITLRVTEQFRTRCQRGRGHSRLIRGALRQTSVVRTICVRRCCPSMNLVSSPRIHCARPLGRRMSRWCSKMYRRDATCAR